MLPDGRPLSVSEDGTLQLWELWDPYGLYQQPSLGRSRLLDHEVSALARLPDGRALSGSRDGTLRLWGLTDKSHVLGGHTNRVNALAVLPDGRALSGSHDYTLRLWDLESGQSHVLKGHTSRVNALAVLPDGRVLSGSHDWSAIVWDLARGAPIAGFVGDAAITRVAVTPTHIIAGSNNGVVHRLQLRL